MLSGHPGAGQQILTSSAEPDYPPLSLADADGKADGFAVELAQGVRTQLGKDGLI